MLDGQYIQELMKDMDILGNIGFPEIYPSIWRDIILPYSKPGKKPGRNCPEQEGDFQIPGWLRLRWLLSQPGRAADNG